MQPTQPSGTACRRDGERRRRLAATAGAAAAAPPPPRRPRGRGDSSREQTGLGTTGLESEAESRSRSWAAAVELSVQPASRCSRAPGVPSPPVPSVRLKKELELTNPAPCIKTGSFAAKPLVYRLWVCTSCYDARADSRPIPDSRGAAWPWPLDRTAWYHLDGRGAEVCRHPQHRGHDLAPAFPGGETGQEASASEERDEEEERRKRRREKNKVAAARCRNKKKERTEFLQRESERLELMNAELKAQIEELKQERQQLILMLNRHRPTCIVRTDSVKTPENEANPLLEQLEKK